MIIKNNSVELALSLIENGEIIIIPTDTLYGFSFDAYNSMIINKFNKFKKRNSPLSIIVDSIKMAKKYVKCKEVDLVQHLLPGPFTFLFSKIESQLSPLITQNSDKIGIRIPNNKFCIEIVKKLKRPIVTTSVNFHGFPSIKKIKNIENSFSQFSIFNGLENINSEGSTIIDMTLKPPKIIRQGDGVFNL
jgi:L-threonylcarbamoyladenylate synthase